MKKLLFVLACAASALTAGAAPQPQKVAYDKLPMKSQEFITKYMPAEKVEFVELNRDSSWEKYTVYFTNGNTVTFDGGSGDCTQIVFDNGNMPVAVLPTNVTNYVKTGYPQARIVMMEKIADGYRVKLSDGCELLFNEEGKFIKSSK